MIVYRERLWASPWTFVAAALVIPASLVVFAPISLLTGVVVAVLLYGACAVLLVVSSPTLEVTGTDFRAGRAHIPRPLLGPATAFSGGDAFVERGQRLDARAWSLLRGTTTPVVRIPILDPDDPAPYWLVSTRHPDALTRALNSATDD